MELSLFVLVYFCISSILASPLSISLEKRSPMKPLTQSGPTLERFDSATSSFGRDSQPNSPSSARSHSNPSSLHSSPSRSPARQRHEEHIDPKKAAKVAQSYSRLHAIAGVHSVAKGIAMTPFKHVRQHTVAQEQK